MRGTRFYDLLFGVSVGIITGILFSPYAGRKTRAHIARAANHGASYMKHRGEEMGDSVMHLMDLGRDEYLRHRGDIADMIRRGANACKQAVS
jgi:gas vesicle protein